MTPEERTSLKIENVKGTSAENLLESETAKNLAIQHLFERASVARELHAAAMLLRRGIGRVSVEEARGFARADDRFVHRRGELVTTHEGKRPLGTGQISTDTPVRKFARCKMREK
jgi:hypothetical protein